MACPHLDSLTLRPPTAAQSVYREDCTQCFDSIDDPAGLDVCLQCFNGGCAGERNHASLHRALWSHPLVLNIRRSRKVVVRDEPPFKMSKLAIAAETDEDRYDTKTTVRCLECSTELDQTSEKLAPLVEGILKANTFSRKEEVKAWEQELTSCEHILLLQQSEGRTIEPAGLGHCSSCDLKENLWLCLECGALGCGRKQMGGVDGNSHALAHATASGHGVAVKLGSITPEGTADVYCYKCDDERIDSDLNQHLAHWGIILAEQQKTEKSLTEMQIEQNLKWDFSMTNEDGQELKPLTGPSLTGLKNLGNSCYLASIIQCLFDMPSFKTRYFQPNLDLPVVEDPAADLETQLRKMADGLHSGRYSKPDPEAPVSDETPHLTYQKGLAPAMLKHLIGRGHAEFSTMRQQDAFELLQHLFKLITRTNHPAGLQDPTQQFRFVLEQRLQCTGCKKVRYTTNEQDNIFINVPLEKLPATEDGEAKADQYAPVTLKECLDNFTAEEAVELTCSSCGSKDGYTKRSLFKTLPDVLVVNAKKMAIINWVPVKIDVPVIVPDEAFPLDAYLSPGVQPGEEQLPEDAESRAPSFEPNAEAVVQLEAMGFPRNRCEKALHATGNASADSAMEWLFAHMEDPDIDAPLDLGGAAAGGDTADPEKIDMLGAMGFGAPQAKKALRETAGDVERALQSIVCHKGTSIHAGHYVAFIRQAGDHPSWVLFNDEKVVEAGEVEEMRKFAYVYFFKRV
ncbi:Protein rax1 [Verticillium dahliae VDG2]|nr:Protein rax1 [Verticillium dahliae VDG2]